MNFSAIEIKKFEDNLISKGYRKLNDNFKRSDYTYWKSFGVTYDENNEKVIQYQVAFAIYNFGKFPDYKSDTPFGIQNEFLLGNNEFVDRVDFSVCDKDMTVEQFECICKNFYENTCVNIIFKQKSGINIEYGK